PQTDFSAGELDVEAKRSNDPLLSAGGRQVRNWRILNTRKLNNRPGRKALFPTGGRTENILAAPGQLFRFCFGEGTLIIRDAQGVVVASNSGYAWTSDTVKDIVLALANRSSIDADLVMTYPGQRPKIARFSNGAWSFLDFNFAKNSSGATL